MGVVLAFRETDHRGAAVGAVAGAEERPEPRESGGHRGGAATEQQHTRKRIGGHRLRLGHQWGWGNPRLGQRHRFREGRRWRWGGISEGLGDLGEKDRLGTLLDKRAGAGGGHRGDVGGGGLLRRDANDVGDAGGGTFEDGAGGATGAEMGHHDPIHDPLARRPLCRGIEAIAEDDLAAPVGEGDKEEEAVVAGAVAESPAIEEVGGKAAVGLTGSGGDDDDDHVGPRRVVDRSGEPCNLGAIGGREAAGLVDHPCRRPRPQDRRRDLGPSRRKHRQGEERNDKTGKQPHGSLRIEGSNTCHGFAGRSKSPVRSRHTQWMWLAGFPAASGWTLQNSMTNVGPSTR